MGNPKGLVAVRMACDGEERFVDPLRAERLVKDGNAEYVNKPPEARTATAKPGKTASKTKAKTSRARSK